MSKILKENNKILTLIVYAICGILCALPAVFNELWFLGWIAYVPVIAIEYLRADEWEKSYRKAWFRGLAFFFAYGLVIFFWLWELFPMDFAGFSPVASLGIIILAWIGIPLFQSIFSAFNVVLLCFLKKKRAPLWLCPISAAFAWIFFEWLQTLTWAGIPWGKLAIGQVGALWNIQSASLFGSYFISFLMILFAGLIAIGIVHLYKNKNIKNGVLAIICSIGVFASNALYGVSALGTDRESIDTINVALIQANITTQEKWYEDPDGAMATHRESAIKAAKNGPDLIIMAETAFPFVLNSDNEVLQYVEDMAKDAGVDIILGCFYEDASGNIYNSTVYVSAVDGVLDSAYCKQKLVPFGEYVPMRSFITTVFPFLAEINILSDDLSPGESSEIFEVEIGNIGSLICFDSIYENVALRSVRNGAEILAISTNDCWFQDSAAVYQHNAHAILRSIETGRYTMRAANTGISSIITNKGEIAISSKPLVQGRVNGHVKLFDYNTLYVCVGNIIVAIAALWIGITMIMVEMRWRKGKTQFAQSNSPQKQYAGKKKSKGKKKKNCHSTKK